MASCMIESGTDGLATHHKATLGPTLGSGGTFGGEMIAGGWNAIGLGTVPPPTIGDGTKLGGLGTMPPVGDGMLDGGLGS